MAKGNGKTIKDGYVIINRSSHPNADKYGRIREHVLNFAEAHKCCLLPWSVVHHRDGRRDNNSVENLEAMMRSKHTALHHKPYPHSEQTKKFLSQLNTKDMSHRRCHICNTMNPGINTTGRGRWYLNQESEVICRNCYERMRRQPKGVMVK